MMNGIPDEVIEILENDVYGEFEQTEYDSIRIRRQSNDRQPDVDEYVPDIVRGTGCRVFAETGHAITGIRHHDDGYEIWFDPVDESDEEEDAFDVTEREMINISGEIGLIRQKLEEGEQHYGDMQAGASFARASEWIRDAHIDDNVPFEKLPDSLHSKIGNLTALVSRVDAHVDSSDRDDFQIGQYVQEALEEVYEIEEELDEIEEAVSSD